MLKHPGSEVAEAAAKLTRQYFAKEKPCPEPDRYIFIARERSYHGATLGALGSSGHAARRDVFEPILPKNTVFISPCNPYRDMADGQSIDEYVEDLADELDRTIHELGPHKVAGFWAEPVVGAVSCFSSLRAGVHVARMVVLFPDHESTTLN